MILAIGLFLPLCVSWAEVSVAVASPKLTQAKTSVKHSDIQRIGHLLVPGWRSNEAKAPTLGAPQLGIRHQARGLFRLSVAAVLHPLSRQLVTTINATRESRTIRQAEKFRSADSTRPKEWLEIEKVRPIGFIGKDILAIEKKITEPSEIVKQNQGFEISRLLDQQREQEQHPGIDR